MTQEKKFEELKSRAQKVNESAIKLNTQLESAHDALKKIQDLAGKKFDTCNLAEIKAMSQKWSNENEEKYNKLNFETNKKEKEVNEKSALIKQIQAV